ncbi:MAG TPA: periplasmic heavy metal sensor [Desulfonatronum sp.]|nr:periplasmic heavy metal sensor [Desulfonatronum sp.]
MRRYSLATLTLLTLVLLSTAAVAQQFQQNAPRSGKVQASAGQAGPYSGLTEEQQATILRLRDEHRKTVMPLGLQMKAKQAELDVLLAAPQAVQKMISSVTSEITTLHEKILSAQNDYRRKVFEKTGHLVRGGMNRSAKGHVLSGRKSMSPQGSLGNCPRMATPRAIPSE